MIGSATTRVAASALVATLEAGPRTKTDLQAELGLSSFVFGRALADARLHGYVTIRKAGDDDVVELTPKGVTVLEQGRAALLRGDTDEPAGPL